MRLSDVSPAKSKAAVESAAASAFTSNADNATLFMKVAHQIQIDLGCLSSIWKK